jgi:uncharacterized membrane protein YhaH (DUF805 family)
VAGSYSSQIWSKAMQFALAFLQNSPLNQEQIQHLVVAMFALIPLFILIGMIIIIVPTWFICKKAGFSPWLSLLCLVPSLGLLVLLYVLAFAEWKVAPVLPPQMGYPYPPPPPRV